MDKKITGMMNTLGLVFNHTQVTLQKILEDFKTELEMMMTDFGAGVQVELDNSVSMIK